MDMMALKVTPPEDDVCPVCFGDYVLPHRAQCGHWFCGSCILQVWNYGYRGVTQPCKCPMCNGLIKVLTPAVSTNQQDSTPTDKDESRKVAEAIERYNRLFVEGSRCFLQRIRETPFFIRRMVQNMTDPNQLDAHYMHWKLISYMLVYLYILSPFDFVPRGVTMQMFASLISVVLMSLVKLVGWYRRRRSAERVRMLAAAEFVFVQPGRNETTD